METLYKSRIAYRSTLRFLFGTLSRIPNFIKFKRVTRTTVSKGGQLGKNATISPDFVCKFNSLAEIGGDTLIAKGCDMTCLLYPITIGRNVIIGNDIKLIFKKLYEDNIFEHHCDYRIIHFL